VTQQNVDWLVTNLTNQREVLGAQAEILKEVSSGMTKVSSQVDVISKVAEQASAAAAAAQQQATAAAQAAAAAAGDEKGGAGVGSSSFRQLKTAGRRSRFNFSR
jgi:methyl-accepting chemotaxis protein